MRFFLLVSILTLCATGCKWEEAHTYHDPALKMKREDYERLLSQKPSTPPTTPLKPHVDQEDRWPKAYDKRVTLTTLEAIPLKDVFYSLAQQAHVNIVLDPAIQGGATLHLKNLPLKDVIQDICAQHRLRYEIRRQTLSIQPDRPYLKTYPLEFLVLTRSNQNRFTVATDVFTAGEGSPQGEENGSNTELKGETKIDFWQELKDNLDVLLQPEVFEEGTPAQPSRYTLHKQAGMVSIFGTQAQHQQIKSYLEQLRQSVQQQVLIEAKILEVNLNDEYKSGINWNVLTNRFFLESPLGAVATVGKGKTLAPQRNIFTIGGSGSEVTGLLSFLNSFGTVRTLSNPRMTVINNQSAVLKVATNKVYFKLNYTKDYSYYDKREQIFVSSDARTVPIGLVLVVHPSIRFRDGKIVMTLRPTISRVIQEVPDPAVGIASNQQQASYVPEVQVREMDSVLVMNSGEMVVVGGLMEERSDNGDVSVPGLGEVPVLNTFFGGKSDARRTTELVVLIRTTIIDPEGEQPHLRASTLRSTDTHLVEKLSQTVAEKPIYMSND
jgi:MSHA type pilus biogenesis protein MshL